MKKSFLVFVALTLVGCSSTEYPIYKTEVYDNFSSVSKTKKESRQTKNSITITDLGRVSTQIIPPTLVHACDNGQLLYQQVKKTDFYGNTAIINEAVMESIDPFEGMHIRRISLTNNSGHTIKLVDVDAVLVDPNGNDHVMTSRERLERHINSKRPCSSTRSVISAFDDVAFLANPIRVRPGRTVQVYVPFPSKDNLDLAGEWLFQINDFPTRTAESGEITKRDTFSFPIEVKQTATTVNFQKDGIFSGWKEIDRQTVDVK